MSPITLEDALTHTDPNGTDEERKEQALAIQAGVAANDIYWSHADPLSALKAQAEGHGQVVSEHADSAAALPTADAEGSAVDEGATAGTTPAVESSTDPPPPPSPDNPTEAVAKLRAQLVAAGINPDAA